MNYVFCHKCRMYLPLWHPEAIAFYSQHSSCSHVSERNKYFLNTTEVLVVGDPQPEPVAAVSTGQNYPEGYACDLGPLEELAYCTKPDHVKLG
jgi:hypothetical protein